MVPQSKTRAAPARQGMKDRDGAIRGKGSRVAVPAGPPPARGSPFAAVRKLIVGEEQAGQRLDNFLLRLAKGVPKSHVYQVVRSGQVRVNGGRTSVEYRLEKGDELRIPPMRVAAAAAKAPAPAQMPAILFEDDHLLALDKPAGVAAHGGSGIAHGVIERVRAARPNQPFLELAHRLDRETSGVLLLAKTRRCLVALHEQLRAGQVDKRYLALVCGDWVNDRQHVRLPLAKRTLAGGDRRVFVDEDEGAQAHTIFHLRARLGGFSLLEAELKTGRTHQIRVHLAHLGFPILGDDKYGDFELNRRAAKGEFGPRLGRMFLHAFRVRLAHPVSGVPLTIEAPLAAECARWLAARDPTGQARVHHG
jgi:23S rRNA pseudouridine955/2504/2580 synthase